MKFQCCCFKRKEIIPIGINKILPILSGSVGISNLLDSAHRTTEPPQVQSPNLLYQKNLGRSCQSPNPSKEKTPRTPKDLQNPTAIKFSRASYKLHSFKDLNNDSMLNPMLNQINECAEFHPQGSSFIGDSLNESLHLKPMRKTPKNKAGILKSRKSRKPETKITREDSDQEIVTLKQLRKNPPVDNPSLRVGKKANRSRRKTSSQTKSSTDPSKGSGSSSGPDWNDRSSKQVSNCSNMSYINTVNHVTN
jgi:hypothetical protein